MTPTELFADNFTTQLVAPVAVSDLQITVAGPAPASLQAAGEFRVVIESEIMVVTGGASGTVWTVVRGSGTGESPTPTAVAHQAGAVVSQVLTEGAITNALVNAEQVAEGVSSVALSSETSRAEGAESTNASSISAETTRAEGVEAGKASTSALSAETSRAEGAESTETTRAETAEATNASAISSETTRAEGAESTNATAISTETTRAKTAEAAAQANAIAASDPVGAAVAARNQAIALAVALGG